MIPISKLKAEAQRDSNGWKQDPASKARRKDRRLEQKAMCRFLESDLYHREPIPEANGSAAMLWESPLKWRVLFSIPSSLHGDDPDYNDREEIDLWIIDPDGQLYRHLPNAVTEDLMAVLP